VGESEHRLQQKVESGVIAEANEDDSAIIVGAFCIVGDDDVDIDENIG
jgi:hypothetical protein